MKRGFSVILVIAVFIGIVLAVTDKPANSSQPTYVNNPYPAPVSLPFDVPDDPGSYSNDSINVGNSSQICLSCHGSGSCDFCFGTGQDSMYLTDCTACGGTGICSICGGDGFY